jgi:hypothetical protein
MIGAALDARGWARELELASVPHRHLRRAQRRSYKTAERFEIIVLSRMCGREGFLFFIAKNGKLKINQRFSINSIREPA